MSKQLTAFCKRSDTSAPGLTRCVAGNRRIASTILSAMMAMAVSGCDAREAPKPPPSEFVPAKPVELTLSGYNYTNRYIDQFSVNGIGGGNLHVSTVTSGGTNVCCFSYTPGTPAPKTVTVKWVASGCTYIETKRSDYISTRAHHFFKTLEVPVDPNVPANPGYFDLATCSFTSCRSTISTASASRS